MFDRRAQLLDIERLGKYHVHVHALEGFADFRSQFRGQDDDFAENAAFSHFTDEFDERLVEKRFDLSLEILKIDSVDLCRDFQRKTGPSGDFYRPVRALFSCDTPKKMKSLRSIGNTTRTTQVRGGSIVD